MRQVKLYVFKCKIIYDGLMRFFFHFISQTSLICFLVGFHASVCEASPPKFYSIQADLRADVNRDGLIDLTHNSGKQGDKQGQSHWSLQRGALVLANLDDDAGRCNEAASIKELSVTACNDSKDTIINGKDDFLDLAPLRLLPWNDAPDQAQAFISISAYARNKARLFIQNNSNWQWLTENKKLNAKQLREGVNLRIEALDIVRDHRVWDGRIEVILTVTDGKAKAVDSVQLHVAPLILQTDLMKMKRLYLPGMPWGQDDPGSTTALPDTVRVNRRAVDQSKNTFPAYLNILEAAKPGLSATSQANTTLVKLGLLGSAYKAFFDDFVSAVEKSSSKTQVIGLPTFEDPWIQDMFEMAYSAVPLAEGKVQVMQMAIRSAQPQRLSAQTVLAKVIGSNTGIVEQWADDSGLLPENGDYSLNSTGNFGTVPPYSIKNKNYPQGRILYGAGKAWVQTGGGILDSSIGGGELVFTDRLPDASFVKMLNSQGLQKPIVINTAWLSVGHIDEIVAFVPANTKRGWKVVVADPKAAWGILTRIADQGLGNTKFLSKLEPWAYGLVPEELDKTVNDIINNPSLAEAQKFTDAQIANVIRTLKIETGIKNSDIIRVPVLFEPNYFNPKNFIATTPNAANLVVISNHSVAVAKQHGPLVNGIDVFESVIANAFTKVGLSVHWVEDYIQAHGGIGEIHCQSNAIRRPGKSAKWWQPELDEQKKQNH